MFGFIFFSHCQGYKWSKVCCWVQEATGQGQATSWYKSRLRYDHAHYHEVKP